MRNEPTGDYTKTPNAILEAMPGMGEAELKLTAVLVRETYGRHQDEVKMTYDDMMIMASINSRTTISEAIDRIERRGFFVRGRRSMWIVNSPVNGLNELDESPLTGLNELDESPVDGLFEPENSPVNGLDDSPLNGLFQSYKEREEKESERNAPAHPNGFWVIPEKINAPAFITAWGDWLRYVDERGISFTEIQAVRALGKLADCGIDTAVASVSRSIDRGWKNIHIEETAVADSAQFDFSTMTDKGW